MNNTMNETINENVDVNESEFDQQFDHYITKNIRDYYKRRIWGPAVFLLLLIVLSFFLPLRSLVFPTKITNAGKISTLYNKNQSYVQVTLHDLYFTGYTKEWLGQRNGYYYYTIISDRGYIVLLDPKTCDQGISTIEEITIDAKIVQNSIAASSLMEKLSTDLNWTNESMSESFSSYMLDEPASSGWFTMLFILFLKLFVLYAVLHLLICALSIAFPVLSRPCRRLYVYGNPKKILEEAEEELKTLPQLATEDMFITQHYFIETSSYGVAIVPIKEIVWIYKYSTLHKFLWHHFSISYTLYITANKRRYIRCPKNTKSDIDGIIDYLAEANHDILVGFNEKNRQKVEKMQGDYIFLQKFFAFLSKKV